MTPPGHTLTVFDRGVESKLIIDKSSEVLALGVFHVLPVWARKSATLSRSGAQGLASSSSAEEVLCIGNHDSLDVPTSAFFLSLQPLFSDPSSRARIAWTLVGICLVLYDIVWIPFGFFDPAESDFVDAIAWISRVFWLLDIPLNFVTGTVRSDGSLNTNVQSLSKQYLISYFMLDLIVVLFDWLFFMFASGGSLGMFRVLRIIRFVRIVKIPKTMGRFAERIESENALLLVDIAQGMACVCGLVHFSACMWYALGQSGEQRGQPNWLAEYKVNGTEIGFRYATSFHWSLSQFHGAMHVNPQSTNESAYAIFCLLFAFVVSASFVGCITTSMTRLQIISSHRSTQFSTLRKYLRDNGVSTKLARRVRHNATHALEELQRYTPEKDVEYLQLVSGPLRSEVHFEVYSPIMMRHGFFQHLAMANYPLMRRVCHSSISSGKFCRGEVLFSDGEMPKSPQMIFVCRGFLQYSQNSTGYIAMVDEGEWLAEPLLWTEWCHQGDLIAGGDCKLLLMDVRQFQDIAPRFDATLAFVIRYAAEYVARLNKIDPDALSDLKDLIDTDQLVNSISEGNTEQDVLASRNSFRGRFTVRRGHQGSLQRPGSGRSSIPIHGFALRNSRMTKSSSS